MMYDAWMYEALDLEGCRALLTEATSEELPEKPEWLFDMVLELLEKEGETVLRMDWDSGGPGAGAGIMGVDRLHGRYFTMSTDYGRHGPLPSLEDAIAALGFEEGIIPVTGATAAISCTEWSDQELILRLDLESWEPRPRLYLNGEHWYLEELEWERRKLLGLRR